MKAATSHFPRIARPIAAQAGRFSFGLYVRAEDGLTPCSNEIPKLGALGVLGGKLARKL